MTIINKSIDVSIILPVFNGDKFISQAIDSVLEQTHKNLELIIVDDGSNDKTVSIVKEFEDSRIRMIKHKVRRGVCTAKNTGIKVAKGTWLAFIDVDDTWNKNRLKKLIKIGKEYPNSFIGSNLMICFSGKNRKLIPWKTLYDLRGINPDYLYFPDSYEFVKYKLSTLPMIPKHFIDKKKLYFNQEYYGHDWLYFLLKLYSIGLRYIIIKDPLYNYRISSSSDSSSYLCIKSQLAAIEYLKNVKWVNIRTRQLVEKNIKHTKYRLLTTALREKLYKESLIRIISSPMSLVYLLKGIVCWLIKEIIRITKIYE